MMQTHKLKHAELAWLNALEVRLQAKGSEKKKTSGKSITLIVHWCIEQGLVPDNSLNLPEFSFTLPLLERISTTQQQLKQSNFRELLKDKNRLENAALSDQEIKSLGIQPRQHRVLIYLTEPVCNSQNMQVQIVDSDWHDIDLTPFDTLVVVENLDCFYQLNRFVFHAAGFSSPLIIYRGDRMYSKGSSTLKKVWQETGKPAYYFGDFDPKGVSIALHEGYQAMLLPSLAEVTQSASVTMFPDEQLKFLSKVANTKVDDSFGDYLTLLLAQKALRQQKMQSKPLYIKKLYS
ncbi:DUF7281 domain-containing protein [Xenorhabdus bovienii]|uniref:DUF7281 domain-containing protein n=1 Tax=Xenorhabdus bovienii TaxID=40576 RepID=UPI003DA3A6BD